MIHPLAQVQSKNIGEDTQVWQFAIILEGAVIGKNCNINCHTFIENDVVIGDNVTIKSGVYLWDGITVEDNVFIGPSAVFANNLHPRSKQYCEGIPTLIKRGASIGANASILPGITIGEYAMIGMGAVVTKDVPSHALVFGNPATIKAWVDENGKKLSLQGNGIWFSADNIFYKETDTGLTRL